MSSPVLEYCGKIMIETHPKTGYLANEVLGDIVIKKSCLTLSHEDNPERRICASNVIIYPDGTTNNREIEDGYIGLGIKLREIYIANVTKILHGNVIINGLELNISKSNCICSIQHK